MNANPSPARRGGSNDSQRAVDLRRVKFAATAALGGCLALLVIARSFEGRHPALGYLAAFAEAAVIGGLADWYAVVALFRHPLGLPIPHTAIIPSNQQLIAEKLGEFIEEEFLDAAPVEAKLHQTDFASFFSEWLDDRKRSGDLARFMLRLMPEAITAAEILWIEELRRPASASATPVDRLHSACGGRAKNVRQRRQASAAAR